MSRAFTHYWNSDTCDWHYSNERSGQPFTHTAGSNFLKKGVESGDIVYGVNVFQGVLFLIGRMEVQEIIPSLERAKEILGEDIWEAPEHLIGDPEKCTPSYFTRQVPVEITRSLRFVGPDGEEKGLKFTDEDVLDQQTLRSIRELTLTSAAILDEFIAQPFQELDPDDAEDDEVEDRDVDDEEDLDDSDIPDEDYTEIVEQFGDAEHNARVEKASVEFATNHLKEEGFAVVSREQDRCGYDLLCTRENEELHVEVKGTSGDAMRYIMTDHEFSTASDDEDYFVFLVTSALSDSPSLTVLDVDTLLDNFQYRPLQWAFQCLEDEET